ncbi:MAG: GNAT family N-acetyltransferase [Eubacterium sp.]|nr:GNAT family N-acetyltransferase [Eubacterium sp.]
MDFILVTEQYFTELDALHSAYKLEIGEDEPTISDLVKLHNAIMHADILFYGCVIECQLVAICSVSKVFSTFNYSISGVFEDFYIAPQFRHKGIARKLVKYAYENSGVSSMTVGCADCDKEMYNALGFNIPLGNMLAYGD